jgi:hypothetical protein
VPAVVPSVVPAVVPPVVPVSEPLPVSELELEVEPGSEGSTIVVPESVEPPLGSPEESVRGRKSSPELLVSPPTSLSSSGGIELADELDGLVVGGGGPDIVGAVPPVSVSVSAEPLSPVAPL